MIVRPILAIVFSAFFMAHPIELRAAENQLRFCQGANIKLFQILNGNIVSRNNLVCNASTGVFTGNGSIQVEGELVPISIRAVKISTRLTIKISTSQYIIGGRTDDKLSMNLGQIRPIKQKFLIFRRPNEPIDHAIRNPKIPTPLVLRGGIKIAGSLEVIVNGS